ncbi:uncharacterized protein A4U43_C02F490 [Asparagus officinalis]|uniref:Uncharacterized protein n=1 Tax=Asparagus officinalis TaxID=4686 RepID=A0A5P1FFG6_ASPOF|nr:uncharacterized protein A4U43_C02F490 [Asparagus officinalis]
MLVTSVFLIALQQRKEERKKEQSDYDLVLIGPVQRESEDWIEEKEMAKIGERSEDLGRLFALQLSRLDTLRFDRFIHQPQNTNSCHIMSNLAAIMAAFIMHNPPQRSPFAKAALKMICFVLKLAFFVKACKDQIDIPKSRIHDEESDGNSTRWLSVRHDSSHADVIAHKHGMVELASLLYAVQETESKMVEM